MSRLMWRSNLGVILCFIGLTVVCSLFGLGERPANWQESNSVIPTLRVAVFPTKPIDADIVLPCTLGLLTDRMPLGTGLERRG